jgi:hypothetical protein
MVEVDADPSADRTLVACELASGEAEVGGDSCPGFTLDYNPSKHPVLSMGVCP